MVSLIKACKELMENKTQNSDQYLKQLFDVVVNLWASWEETIHLAFPKKLEPINFTEVRQELQNMKGKFTIAYLDNGDICYPINGVKPIINIPIIRKDIARFDSEYFYIFIVLQDGIMILTYVIDNLIKFNDDDYMDKIEYVPSVLFTIRYIPKAQHSIIQWVHQSSGEYYFHLKDPMDYTTMEFAQPYLPRIGNHYEWCHLFCTWHRINIASAIHAKNTLIESFKRQVEKCEVSRIQLVNELDDFNMAFESVLH